MPIQYRVGYQFFVLFLLSNVAWIVFGLLSHTTGMVVMQAGFTLTSLMGVWRWLIVNGRK